MRWHLFKLVIMIFLTAGTFSLFIAIALGLLHKPSKPADPSSAPTPPTLLAGLTGQGVKVAVLDSGVAFEHPDFERRLQPGYNALDPSRPPLDDFGHGTPVTGVIFAQDNGFGVTGVAPDVQLFPVKVLDRYGEGDIDAVVRGLDWCIANGIHIVNMSFAVPEPDDRLHAAIRRAYDAGIVLVAAAENTFGGAPGYPASYEEVISVTAVDADKKPYRGAPKGKIDFAARGVDILSTSTDGGYERYSGTSIAAPRVTGWIARILQKPEAFDVETDNPGRLHVSVYEALRQMAEDLGEPGPDEVFGAGWIG